MAPRLKDFMSAAAEDPTHEKEASHKKTILRFLKRRVLPLVLVTVAAGLGTSPILAYHFQRISIAGLAANLVVVPIAGVVVPLLLSAAALLPVSETLAWAVLFPADLAFGLLAAVVGFFASIPYASLWVAPPAPYEIALYYLLLLSLLSIWKTRVYRYTAFAAIVFLVIPWASLASREAAPVLRVTYLSVGQGDSAFLELPGKKIMLIDGGGTNNPDFDTGERVVAPFLRTQGVEKIDYMVLSHAQQDHMGGLFFLAQNFDIGEFWWNGEGELGRLGSVLEKNGVMQRIVNSSAERIRVGGAVVEFFNPSQGLSSDENDNSLVFKISYGQRSFLFTGDISEKAERLLSGRDLKSDVLKAPHHGSKYSSSAEFLSMVAPSTVVISAGWKNSFGFPHKETLSRYESVGVQVLRTDKMGALVMETDGKRLEKKGYLTDTGL